MRTDCWVDGALKRPLRSDWVDEKFSSQDWFLERIFDVYLWEFGGDMFPDVKNWIPS